MGKSLLKRVKALMLLRHRTWFHVVINIPYVMHLTCKKCILLPTPLSIKRSPSIIALTTYWKERWPRWVFFYWSVLSYLKWCWWFLLLQDFQRRSSGSWRDVCVGRENWRFSCLWWSFRMWPLISSIRCVWEVNEVRVTESCAECFHYLLEPAAERTVSKIQPQIVHVVCLVLFLLFLIDCFFSALFRTPITY